MYVVCICHLSAVRFLTWRERRPLKRNSSGLPTKHRDEQVVISDWSTGKKKKGSCLEMIIYIINHGPEAEGGKMKKICTQKQAIHTTNQNIL